MGFAYICQDSRAGAIAARLVMQARAAGADFTGLARTTVHRTPSLSPIVRPAVAVATGAGASRFEGPSRVVSVAKQPVDLCLAGISPLEDQPGEVGLAAAGLLAPCNDISWRHRWSRRKQPDPPKRQLLQPPSGVQTSYWKQQRDLARADLKRMTGKGFDRVEWRISDEGRRRRLAVEEILNQASRVAAINDVGGDDGMPAALAASAMRPNPVQGSSRTWLR